MKKFWLYLMTAVTFLMSASFAIADTVTYTTMHNAVFVEVQEADRTSVTVLATAKVTDNKQLEPSAMLGDLPKHRVLADLEKYTHKQRVGNFSASMPKPMPEIIVGCDAGFIVDGGVLAAT